MKGRWNFSSTFSKQIVLPTKSWNYQGPWSKSAQPKVRWAPNLRGVVCWPLRYPLAEQHESQGSGIPEQLPPNLGEKQDPFAHFVLLPTYHVASVEQVSVWEHWCTHSKNIKFPGQNLFMN